MAVDKDLKQKLPGKLHQVLHYSNFSCSQGWPI